MQKITILIPVHNNLDFTKKCLHLLTTTISDSSLTKSSYDIIVIDDGSTDSTNEWINENYPDVTVLKGDGNLWWSGGINMGANYVIDNKLADYILLWNNDITPSDDYFSMLDTILSNTNQNQILGSKIFFKDNPGVIWSYGGIFNPGTGKRFMIGYGENDKEEYSVPIQVDWLPGMGTLIPLKVIEHIGLWDNNNFPQYHGDSDYTFRAKTAGYDLVVYPQLKLWNDKSNSGIMHEGKFRKLFQILVDTRSNFHLRKNLLFYRRHSKSIFAYAPLLRVYLRLFGGFFKWKLLGVFGIKRKNDVS